MFIKKAGKSKNLTRNQNVNSSNILIGHINLALLFIVGKTEHLEFILVQLTLGEMKKYLLD